jgi:hypothetical protein
MDPESSADDEDDDLILVLLIAHVLDVLDSDEDEEVIPTPMTEGRKGAASAPGPSSASASASAVQKKRTHGATSCRTSVTPPAAKLPTPLTVPPPALKRCELCCTKGVQVELYMYMPLCLTGVLGVHFRVLSGDSLLVTHNCYLPGRVYCP